MFYVPKKIQLATQPKQPKINLTKNVQIIILVLLHRKFPQHYRELILLYTASYDSFHVDLIKLFSELSSWSYTPNGNSFLLTLIYDFCSSGQ